MESNKKRLFEIMGKLDDSFKLRINEEVESDIDESGYSRLSNTIAGNVDSINTYGIFTSQNPMGVQSDDNENINRFNQLKSDLRSMGYGFVLLYGMYGIPEDSLGVQNISLNDIQALSEKYNQDTYVFGIKQNKDGETYFKWDMIKTETKQPVADTKYTALSNREDVKNSNDFYSVVNPKWYKTKEDKENEKKTGVKAEKRLEGTKFQIPFFNDDDIYKKPQTKYGNQAKGNPFKS